MSRDSGKSDASTQKRQGVILNKIRVNQSWFYYGIFHLILNYGSTTTLE